MNSLKMPLHEAIDRFTILTLKRERLRDEKDRPSVENEYAFYKKILDAYRADGVDIPERWIADLLAANTKCWDEETAVRLGRERNLTDEDVGRHMIALRDFNRERVQLKNGIVRESGMDFATIKHEENTPYKTALPETIEKIGILEMKRDAARDETERRAVEQELHFYRKVLDAHRADGVSVKDEWVSELKDINAKSWEMEKDITLGREAELGLAEVGRRTLLLRDRSKIRDAYKKKIAEEIGLGFYELKTETT